MPRRKQYEGTPAEHAALEQLRIRLETWRREGKGRHIPEELWEKATELGVKLGVYTVRRKLGLHYPDIKRRVADAVAAAKKNARPADQVRFVELVPPTRSTIDECCIEVESPSGRRLRLTLKNVANADISALVRELGG